MESNRNELCSELREGNGVKFMITTSEAGFKFDSGFPEWLLVEVLIRLPAKVVSRFKLVSKQWLSVISDPSFIHMYVSRALLLPQRWTLIVKYMQPNGNRQIPGAELFVDVRSEDLKFPGLYVLPRPSIDEPHENKYSVVGVSNGLVLYLQYDRVEDAASYGIINPVTGQCIAIPFHFHARHRTVSKGFVSHVKNGILTSYRIVELTVSSYTINLEVFVSETGTWQQFAVHMDHRISLPLWSIAIELNGILHWTTHKNGIMAYDPYWKPDCFRFIALPAGNEDLTSNGRYRCRFSSSLCGVHEGQLRYFEMSRDCVHPHGLFSITVWILNDYSTGEWCLQYRFSYADILYDDMFCGQSLFLDPVSFHPFDPDTVYLGFGNKLYSFSMKSRKLEVQGGVADMSLILGGKQLRWKRVKLLVIPPWPVLIPPQSFGVMA